MTTTKLHDDLTRHIEKDTALGDFIKHPLLFMAGYDESMTDMVNESYKRKYKEAEKARKNKDWTLWLMLHERPYRLDAFMSVCSQLQGKEYWKHLAWVWIGTEFPTVNKDVWLQLFTRKMANRRKMMSGKERRTLYNLPDEDIDIYRGYGDDEHADGISWTLSYEKADWFAKRWNSENALIAEGVCKKKDIIAFLDKRGEQEIIIDPDNVDVRRAQGVL